MYGSQAEHSVTPLNVEMAALRCGLSVSTLNRLRVTGGGPAFIKIGRRVCYALSDLDGWLAMHKRRSTSDVGVAA